MLLSNARVLVLQDIYARIVDFQYSGKMISMASDMDKRLVNIEEVPDVLFGKVRDQQHNSSSLSLCVYGVCI